MPVKKTLAMGLRMRNKNGARLLFRETKPGPLCGKVYLVGAGPGDPGLITVKGLSILKKADVVLYDNLIPKELLKQARRGARLIDAGKRPGKHVIPQEKINELLFRYARRGFLTVRLKGGDPYVFGRGGEEALYLRERGIEVEVVPGVSSAIAVPALAGIPLTQRHLAMTAAFASGHVTEDNDPIPVPNADTLVYVMCVTHLDKTVRRIIKKKKVSTPCAMIENGTTPQERVITGTLADIVRKTGEAKIASPAVFVVGEVVSLREKIFSKKILVTGTRADRFQKRGLVTYCPLVKILPARDPRPLDRAVEQLRAFDWILFTSQHAVSHFLERIRRPADLKVLKHKNILAIGPATSHALKTRGFRKVHQPEAYDSGCVLEFLKDYDLRGKKILIPRSSLAGPLIPETLRKRGAEVVCVTAYRNIKLKPSIPSLNGFDEIIFTCPSTVRNFFHYFKKISAGAEVYSIGPVTKAQLEAFGVRSEVLEHVD